MKNPKFDERAGIVRVVFIILAALITALPALIIGINALSSRYNNSEVLVGVVILIFVIPIAGCLGNRSAKHLIEKTRNNEKISGVGDGVKYGAICGALANIPIYVGAGNLGFMLLIFAIPVGAVVGLVAGMIGAAIVFPISRAYLLKE